MEVDLAPLETRRDMLLRVWRADAQLRHILGIWRVTMRHGTLSQILILRCSILLLRRIRLAISHLPNKSRSSCERRCLFAVLQFSRIRLLGSLAFTVIFTPLFFVSSFLSALIALSSPRCCVACVSCIGLFAMRRLIAHVLAPAAETRIF